MFSGDQSRGAVSPVPLKKDVENMEKGNVGVRVAGSSSDVWHLFLMVQPFLVLLQRSSRRFCWSRSTSGGGWSRSFTLSRAPRHFLSSVSCFEVAFSPSEGQLSLLRLPFSPPQHITLVSGLIFTSSDRLQTISKTR